MAFVAVTNPGAVPAVSTLQPRALGASVAAAVSHAPDAGRAEGCRQSSSALVAATGLAGAAGLRRRARRSDRTVVRQGPKSSESKRTDVLTERKEITADTDAGALQFETSPRESEDGVLQLAQQAGLNLDVKPWDFLSGIAKDAARSWFVQRAEERGIAWTDSVAGLQAQQDKLDDIYTQVADPKVTYPSYYTLPFHGYDTGNMSWNAAHELEAATQSMCLGYYDGMSWQDAQEMFRGSARKEIAEYWRSAHLVHGDDGVPKQPSTLLDLGCSGGFSTNEMVQTFPGVKATGVDLSPYFLSVAKHTYPEFQFIHGRAESTGLPDGSCDVVTLNFLLHELPLAASKEVIAEAYRLLAPGGIIAILDVDPRRLLELPPFRRWAFQVTEPWCKDGEYYALDLPKVLQSAGFRAVQRSANDPVNELVLATK